MQPLDLLADLRLHDETVRVVLRELPDARQARQHARRLVAMQRCLLVEANRQIAVAAHFARIGEEVPGTVHRLHAHRLAFRFDEEHVLPVVLPVPRPLPERLVEDERRLHFHVAGGEEDVAHVVREDVVKRGALVEPERRARRPLMEREQPELLPKLAMVALLGLFDLGQVRLEILVREEGRAVDALHRLIARVALPVGVGGGEQLERLQLAGRRDVRTDAEVDEGVLVLDRVAGDLALALGLLLDELHFQRLAAPREERLGFFARPASGARRRSRPPTTRASSFQSRRDPPGRTDGGRRSRRRSPRRWPVRCRTGLRGTDSSPRPPADAPCCGGRAGAPRGSCPSRSGRRHPDRGDTTSRPVCPRRRRRAPPGRAAERSPRRPRGRARPRASRVAIHPAA